MKRMLKTAIIIPFRLQEFTKIPFELGNATQTFQRLIDKVLRGLIFAFSYIDDVLIASRNNTEHQQHVEQVFQKLEHFGLKINAEKCTFAVSKLNFLGDVIDEHRITLVPEKISAIKDFPQYHYDTSAISRPNKLLSQIHAGLFRNTSTTH